MSVKLRYVAGGPRIRLRAVPGIQGIQGIPGQVQDIEAGQGIAIDLSDPVHPKISVDAVAAEIPFTPTGQVGSTDAQAAIAELDSKKLSVLDAASNYQPLATDLTTIAGQDNESFGLDLLTMEDAEEARGKLDLSGVAHTGAYADLSDRPTLGTAAAADVADFTTPDDLAAVQADLDEVRAIAETGLMPMRAAVRLLATTNVNVGSALEAGDTLDGETLSTADRVALVGQSDPAQNGIYVVPPSGAASRASDADSEGELLGARFEVGAGTHAGETWGLQTVGPITVGTTALTFVLSNSAAPTTAEVQAARRGAGSLAAAMDLKADIAMLEAVTQSIGYPMVGTIPDGPTSASTGTFLMTLPIEKAGKGLTFSYHGKTTGTVYVIVGSRSGTTNTVEAQVAVSAAAGYHSVVLPDIEYEAGWYFGWRSTSGLLAVTSGAPAQGYRLWATSSLITEGNTFEAASSSQASLHARFDVVEQVVSGDAFLDAQETAQRAAMQTGDIPPDEHLIGRPGTPTSGSGIGGNTYVYSDPAPYDMILTDVSAYVLTAGTMVLKVFDGPTSLLVQDGVDAALTWLGTGVQSGSPADPVILRTGQRLGIFRGSSSIAVNAGGPDSGGVYFAADNVSTLTSPSLNSSSRIEIGFSFERLTLAQRVETLEAQADDPALAHPTQAFQIIWMLGESHVAGRAARSTAVIPDGRGYRFRRATESVAHLQDPTGNDALSTSGDGLGSWGPSLGRALLNLTHGAVGAIIVNSGEGGTTVSDWAAAGASWTQAKVDWDATIAAAAAANLPVAGVTICICIGSNDAGDGTSKSDFKAGVVDLIDRSVAYADAGSVPVAIVMTGPFGDDSYATAVAEIQAAQAEVCREKDDVYMATTAPKFSVVNGWMIDNVHMSQTANATIGPAIATVALAHGTGRYPAGLE